MIESGKFVNLDTLVLANQYSRTIRPWTNRGYTVHPRFFGPRLAGPSINRPGSTGRCIQLFSLKSTRFTVEKKLEKANNQTMLSRRSFFIVSFFRSFFFRFF